MVTLRILSRMKYPDRLGMFDWIIIFQLKISNSCNMRTLCIMYIMHILHYAHYALCIMQFWSYKGKGRRDLAEEIWPRRSGRGDLANEI